MTFCRQASMTKFNHVHHQCTLLYTSFTQFTTSSLHQPVGSDWLPKIYFCPKCILFFILTYLIDFKLIYGFLDTAHNRQCLCVAYSAVFAAWGAAGVSETIWSCGHKDTGAWDTSGSTHNSIISHEQSGEKPPCLGSATALCSHYITYVLEHR